MHAFFHVQYELKNYFWHVNCFGDVNVTKATQLLQETLYWFRKFRFKKANLLNIPVAINN